YLFFFVFLGRLRGGYANMSGFFGCVAVVLCLGVRLFCCLFGFVCIFVGVIMVSFGVLEDSVVLFMVGFLIFFVSHYLKKAADV
ncbi:hypothetical protein, partial [Pseudomonas aeruginosa]